MQIFYSNDVLNILSIRNIDKSLLLTSISEDDILTENNIVTDQNMQNLLLRLDYYGFNMKSTKFSIIPIKESQYSAFSETQSVAKCYINDSVFTISLDDKKEGTDILALNLDTKIVSCKFFTRDQIANMTSFNSLIIDKNIVQISSSIDNYVLLIKDLNGSVLKKISGNEVQKSKSFTEVVLGRIDDLDTKKYFKKVNSGEVAINFAKRYGTLCLFVGSTTKGAMPIDKDEQKNTYSQIGFLTGGLIGGLIGALLDSANDSPSSKSNSELVSNGHTCTQFVFSSDFTSMESMKKDFAHQKLKKQIINSESFSIPSIFYINGTYYLGFYNTNDKKYFFKKFQDS